MGSTLVAEPRPIVGAASGSPRTRGSGVVEVELLSPRREQNWEEYVRRHGHGTLFHTLAWRSLVESTFAHQPFYQIARWNEAATERGRCSKDLDSGRGKPWESTALLRLSDQAVRSPIAGVLPAFLVRSRLAGRLLVSVPYGVSGGILADHPEATSALASAAQELAAELGCRLIEFRSERAQVSNLPVNEEYIGFERALPEYPDDVLGWIPRKARAVVRQARDRHLLSFQTGDELLPEVWRLYSINMRRLGSLAYPRCFLERLLEATPGAHWFSLVHWNGRAVAGLMTLRFQDRAMPYFFGCVPDARRCGAANYLYFRTMQQAVESGCRIFDFGRSRRDNPGSANFKRFHGFEPRTLEYQFYVRPGKKKVNLTPSNGRFRLARAVWPYLPLRLTQMAGAGLLRHIPG